MCEYCGCQSVPAIAELTAEHDQVVELVGQARAAHRRSDLDGLIDACRSISTVLAVHTVAEEEGLFPAMAPDFPDQIAALEADHRRIEAVLSGATDGTARSDPRWPHAVMDVLALLREHIFKEQDGVFPAALATLTNEQWDRLGTIRERALAARA
jgi:hemerythrin-like domain-containing protein